MKARWRTSKARLAMYFTLMDVFERGGVLTWPLYLWALEGASDTVEWGKGRKCGEEVPF